MKRTVLWCGMGSSGLWPSVAMVFDGSVRLVPCCPACWQDVLNWRLIQASCPPTGWFTPGHMKPSGVSKPTSRPLFKPRCLLVQ